ncbi:MAG: Peptidase family [Candidatus Dependentiae bacterium]|nr:Peptidase family [Candidatus Dependentiae bacterium]
MKNALFLGIVFVWSVLTAFSSSVFYQELLDFDATEVGKNYGEALTFSARRIVVDAELCLKFGQSRSHLLDFLYMPYERQFMSEVLRRFVYFVHESDMPRLYGLVKEIAAQEGISEMPLLVIVPYGAQMFHIAVNKPVMYLSFEDIRRPEEELRFTIGHEIAHLKLGHSKLSKRHLLPGLALGAAGVTSIEVLRRVLGPPYHVDVPKLTRVLAAASIVSGLAVGSYALAMYVSRTFERAADRVAAKYARDGGIRNFEGDRIKEAALIRRSAQAAIYLLESSRFDELPAAARAAFIARLSPMVSMADHYAEYNYRYSSWRCTHPSHADRVEALKKLPPTPDL